MIVLSDRSIWYVSSQQNVAASGSQQVADKNVGRADRLIDTYFEDNPLKDEGIMLPVRRAQSRLHSTTPIALRAPRIAQEDVRFVESASWHAG